ncbi:MAG: VCBS repeat-containing protein [Pyrinomonadaceae bacterium]
MKRNFLLGLFLLLAVSAGTLVVDNVSAQNNEPVIETVEPTVAEAGAVTNDANLVAGVGDAPSDFNGDGKTDFVTVRQDQTTLNYRWFILLNGPGTERQLDWGGGRNDFITPADFDGDGSDDVAIWRRENGNSAFYVFQSQTNTFRFIKFGLFNDDPSVVRDYDADGKDDAAIYRRGETDTAASMFWWLGSRPGIANVQIPVTWGLGTDQAVPGDYTGDGRADFVVFRSLPGDDLVWLIHPGTGGGDAGGNDRVTKFGRLGDVAVPGDYDGDGTTDLAVTRVVSNLINWFYRPSSIPGTLSYVQFAWGRVPNGDVEVQGDYDGDGNTDYAVWRPNVSGQSIFLVRGSLGNTISQRWGLPTDQPAAFDAHE